MKKILTVLLISTIAACSSSIKISNTESAPNVDLAKYKTFDFYKLEASGDTVSKGFNERMATLKSAISGELTKRGYTQSSSKPDLLVNIGLQVEEKTQTRETDWRTDGAYRYAGQRNYSWKSEEIVVGYYKEGSVTVHLVDAAQNSMVWKSTAKDILPTKESKVQEAAEAGMKALFEKFPVGVKK
jgi:hypothetical protein